MMSPWEGVDTWRDAAPEVEGIVAWTSVAVPLA